MTRRRWAWVRRGTAAAVLAVILVRLGSGPFLSGLRSVSPSALLAASAIAVVTTACCALRWSAVARALGVPLPFGAALAACYRSQFLNCMLPGGVVGDIDRGLRHGGRAGDRGRCLRVVAWERIAGQLVLAIVACIGLVASRTSVGGAAPVMLAAAALLVIVAALVLVARRYGTPRHARTARLILADLRCLTAPARWNVVVAASLVAVAGYAATFVIAARGVGAHSSVGELAPVTLIVLVAAALPVNLGGWGPREGAAAWAFAGAGLGPAAGVASATAYGVLVALATLPGAVVLTAGWVTRGLRPRATPINAPVTPRELVEVGRMADDHG